jgi:hypothetical protein
LVNVDWSLYKHGDHTHDIPFAYLDEIASMHRKELEREEKKFQKKYGYKDDKKKKKEKKAD